MKTLAVEKAAEAIVTIMRVWYVTIGLLYPLAWVKSVHRCMFVNNNNNNNVTSGQPKQLPHFRLSKQEKGITEIYCTRQIEAVGFRDRIRGISHRGVSRNARGFHSVIL